ncbi:MAG: hypothetical protein ACRC9L_10250 [Brevinema sp.]
MYKYEKTVLGNVDRKKLWELYSNVSLWKEWDTDVENVVLNGEFARGICGIMKMKNGQSLPFTIDSVADEKEFTTVSHLGEITVSFIHLITETSITHVVTIDGGIDEQMDGMGKGITANLPATMDRLLAMVQQ